MLSRGPASQCCHMTLNDDDDDWHDVFFDDLLAYIYPTLVGQGQEQRQGKSK